MISIRDAAIVTAVDAFTSTMGGFTIFSILGFMSYSNKIPIDQLVEAGTGLAFVWIKFFFTVNDYFQ